MPGAAVAPVEAAFPGVRRRTASIDRAELVAPRVLGDPERCARLEAIVHPLVRGAKTAFLARHSAARRWSVLDIPLLFETGGERSAATPSRSSRPRRQSSASASCAPGHDARTRFAAILRAADAR